MEALIAVLAVGGAALGVYELGQAMLKRKHAAEKRRAAAAALADGTAFKATARLMRRRREGSQAAFSGLAVDTERQKLAVLCPGPSTIDSFLEGRIDRGELDEAIHGSLLRQSVRAYLRRRLSRIETPTRADCAALAGIVDRHGWSCGLIDRPLRHAVVGFGDLVEVEVIADGKSVAKTARAGGIAKGDQIIRQIAEDFMAHKSCVGVYLKILVNDLDEPLFLLDLCDSDRKPPESARDSLQEALQWHEILRLALARHHEEAAPAPRAGAARADNGRPAAASMARALKAVSQA